MFAAITFFRDVAITIYVSRPQLQGIISYSDFSPGEIADSLKKDCVMLSAAQIEAISDEWSLIIQNQSNLRIFYKNKVHYISCFDRRYIGFLSRVNIYRQHLRKNTRREW